MVIDMSKEMIKEVAERIMHKVACEKICAENYKDNPRENPLHSERKGMEEMLELMGIEFEYGFDDKYEIISITIEGITVGA